MTISLVGTAVAESTSIVLPSHQNGDLLLLAVGRLTSTIPAIVAGWKFGVVRNITTRCLLIAYKQAGSSSEVSGTWESDLLAAMVFRGSDNYLSVGGSSQSGGNASSAVTYADLFTARTVNSNSRMHASEGWIVGAALATVNSSNIDQAPSGMTLRNSLAGTSAGEIVISDTNGMVSSWSSATVTTSSSINWITNCLEIFESNTPKASSGGGVYNPFLQQRIR